MSDRKLLKASSLLQKYRAEFGFAFDVPAGIASDKARDLGRDADAELLEFLRDNPELESKWGCTGDVNLEYGGAFFDLSDWRHGFCYAVRVTNLDFEFGFAGAVMIEHVGVNGVDDAERIRPALRSCGVSARNWSSVGRKETIKSTLRLMIAEALMSYGFCDVDETEVVQLESDGPMEFENWTADKRLRNADLRGYVEAVHLNR